MKPGTPRPCPCPTSSLVLLWMPHCAFSFYTNSTPKTVTHTPPLEHVHKDSFRNYNVTVSQSLATSPCPSSTVTPWLSLTSLLPSIFLNFVFFTMLLIRGHHSELSRQPSLCTLHSDYRSSSPCSSPYSPWEPLLTPQQPLSSGSI